MLRQADHGIVTSPVCGKPTRETASREWRCDACNVTVETDTDDLED